MIRPVTEADFRQPEFRAAKVEDYEFRDDGRIVRKNRWIEAVHDIKSLVLDDDARDFEIDEVISAVKKLVGEATNTNEIENNDDWNLLTSYTNSFPYESDRFLSIKLTNGCVLTYVQYYGRRWRLSPVTLVDYMEMRDVQKFPLNESLILKETSIVAWKYQ